jgi:hypothetical protein
VTLVIVTTAAATLARIATTAGSGRLLAKQTEMANDLLAQAEAPIQRFLSEMAPSLVLPPDATEPRAEVLADTWQVAGIRFEMTITAFDRCGMVPLAAARDVWLLRGTLPPDVRRAVDRIDPNVGIPGLDQMCGLECASPIFPTAKEGVPALGALVAMHSTGRINAATGPIPVLDAALRLSQKGGLDAIVAARSKKQMPTMTLIASAPMPEKGKVEVVSGSDGWGFRVDIVAGSIRRSWWLVYQLIGPSWRRTQRLAIP